MSGIYVNRFVLSLFGEQRSLLERKSSPLLGRKICDELILANKEAFWSRKVRRFWKGRFVMSLFWRTKKPFGAEKFAGFEQEALREAYFGEQRSLLGRKSSPILSKKINTHQSG